MGMVRSGRARAALALVLSVATMAGCLYSRVTEGVGGASANGDSRAPSISDDGDVVGFLSDASNLVPSDSNGASDVFVRIRSTDAIERVSESETGVGANGPSTHAAVSGNGQFVVFRTTATNLGGAASGVSIYRYARSSGDLDLVATALASTSSAPQISDDGSIVAFSAPQASGHRLTIWKASGAPVLLSGLSTGHFALAGGGGSVVVRHDEYSASPYPARYLRTYDTSTGVLLHQRSVLSGPSTLYDLLVSDDGESVFYSWYCFLTCSGGGITTWDVGSSQLQPVVTSWTPLGGISDSGRHVVFVDGYASGSPELVILDTVTSRQRSIADGTPMAAVNGTGAFVAFTSAASMDGSPASGFVDVYVWSRSITPA